MDWLKNITASVTICDADGIIVYMNDKSAEVFESDGGRSLIGTNLFGCHPEPALSKLRALMASGATNTYTIEKNGKKKLIFQSPWRQEETIAGMVEIAIELPADMSHFIRQNV
jgi:transcriptional regulator with PAS, ATPase and Fis domain